jgi:hypothetical protein
MPTSRSRWRKRAVPDRYVIVVPANAPETLAYLAESFKNVPDVEIVADRRDARAPAAAAPVERRAARRTQEAFGCTLVRIERTAAPVQTPDSSPPATPNTVAPIGRIRLRDLPLLRER